MLTTEFHKAIFVVFYGDCKHRFGQIDPNYLIAAFCKGKRLLTCTGGDVQIGYFIFVFTHTA